LLAAFLPRRLRRIGRGEEPGQAVELLDQLDVRGPISRNVREEDVAATDVPAFDAGPSRGFDLDVGSEPVRDAPPVPPGISSLLGTPIRCRQRFEWSAEERTHEEDRGRGADAVEPGDLDGSGV
jgi:hypothetical protein